MSDAALRLTNITRTYNAGKANAVEVLRGASLTVARGELVGLVAPSGSGKSTLLHIAGLLDTPTGGTVSIAGQDATGLPEKARTAIRRSEIGFVYQFHHLLPEFSALENIALPQRAAGVSQTEAADRASRLLRDVGLEGRASHRPAELSGGEQQRVALCRALANEPGLVLADEPTGNLDPATADQVFALLLRLARETGLAALIATHNHALAAQMDRVLTLDGGTIA